MALLVAALLAVGILSWRYAARSKPAFEPVKPMANLADPAQPPISWGQQSSANPPQPKATTLAPKKPESPASPNLSQLETRAAALVKKMNVADLDPDLPSEHFEDWFRNTMGPDQSYTWELNDCGEVTGNSEIDRQRDIPMCIEARAKGPVDLEIETSIILQVGTEHSGLLTKPVLRGIVQQEGDDITDIKNLHDLVRQIN